MISTKNIALDEDVYNKLRIYIATEKHRTFSDGIAALLEKKEE